MRGPLLVEIHAYCRIYPLERPRLWQGRVFQPKDKHRQLFLELGHYAKGIQSPLDGPLVVDMTIYFRRRAGKLAFPVSPGYGDEDNLKKSVNDALVATKIIVDDRFIIGGESWKFFGEEDHCIIKIYRAKEPK